jgi:hypothetical protein
LVPDEVYETLFLTAAIAAVVGPMAAHATLVSVTTSGNLLALLPASDLASSTNNTSFGAGLTQIDDNFVNTANQDNGLIFADGDPDQRVAITGFNSSIGDIRYFTSPSDPIRFPSTLTIYFSTSSTTSLNPANYTLLVPTTALNGAAFTPVPGSTAAFLDFPVHAPVGTQSLLFDAGNANGLGDRFSEVQAFADTPEPSAAWLTAAGLLLSILGLARSRRAAGRADAK